jgi:hypothetical protein
MPTPGNLAWQLSICMVKRTVMDFWVEKKSSNLHCHQERSVEEAYYKKDKFSL